jgi:hypothetical protein
MWLVVAHQVLCPSETGTNQRLPHEILMETRPRPQHLHNETLENILKAAPPSTPFWIDETYIEYAGPKQRWSNLLPAL